MIDIKTTIPPIINKQISKGIKTIYDTIISNSDYSYFKYILKLSKMDNILNQSHINYTVFVPSDEKLRSKGITDAIFINMDISVARQVVSYCILNNRINKSILNNPIILLPTLNKFSQLLISNNENLTYINNVIQIMKFDIECINGIIHIIDDIPSPIII
jgi:uncharacterized surface protein with fasciclin (FAS1) repeats